jgi:hypothetical protein
MLEILLLYALGKNIAEKAEDQGKGGVLFVILLVVLWFLGEIVGAAVGMIVTGDKLYAYLYGIGGAAVGAILAYTILAVIPLFESALQERPRPRKRRRRVPRRPAEDREDGGRRRRKSDEDEPYEDLVVEEDEKPRPRRQESADYEVVEDDEPRPRRRPAGEIRPDRGPSPPARQPRRQPRDG